MKYREGANFVWNQEGDGMKVRDLITVLAEIGATADIREFEVLAYDADDQRIAPVTGVTWSAKDKTLSIHTDEL